MPLHTVICDMLGVEHPIVLGGLTGPGLPELAAAVSNAGCLGIFCAHMAGTPEKLQEWIDKMETLTSKPFGVNMTILRDLHAGDELAAVLAASPKVKIIETAGSSPEKYIKQFKAAGKLCIHKCTSIRHAVSAIKYGADIISLDGFECAGHPGEDDVGNFALQARGQEMLTVPYICSGGVTAGRQIAAALALGADGVNLGTVICVTKESNWPEPFKTAMVESDECQTCLVNRPFKSTSRFYKNNLAKQVMAVEKEKGDKIKYADVMQLTAGKRRAKAWATGDVHECMVSAGQGIGMIHDVPTVKDCIDRMVHEAEDIICGRLSKFATPRQTMPSARSLPPVHQATVDLPVLSPVATSKL
jgi:nitronate monooxygenase